MIENHQTTGGMQGFEQLVQTPGAGAFLELRVCLGGARRLQSADAQVEAVALEANREFLAHHDPPVQVGPLLAQLQAAGELVVIGDRQVHTVEPVGCHGRGLHAVNLLRAERRIVPEVCVVQAGDVLQAESALEGTLERSHEPQLDHLVEARQIFHGVRGVVVQRNGVAEFAPRVLATAVAVVLDQPAGRLFHVRQAFRTIRAGRHPRRSPGW